MVLSEVMAMPCDGLASTSDWPATRLETSVPTAPLGAAASSKTAFKLTPAVVRVGASFTVATDTAVVKTGLVDAEPSLTENVTDRAVGIACDPQALCGVGGGPAE